MYDLVIIGSGPAGLTAAIYAARYKLDVVVIGEVSDSLAAEAPEVCNFPTHQKIEGNKLMKMIKEQVESLGVEIVESKVAEAEKRGQSNFLLQISDSQKYEAKNVIIATGREKRRLNLEDEEEFLGKGVSYCATCDGPLYQGDIVGVVGGGDSALASATLLSKYADKVYIIYRREEFYRPNPAWVERIEGIDNIETVFNANVTKLKGDKMLSGVKLDNGEELDLDGLFIEIGAIPSASIAKSLGLDLTEKDYVKVDKDQSTSVEGVYAAGDITDGDLKQVITACAQGARAADSIYQELGS